MLENIGNLEVQWAELSVECLQECDQLISWDSEALQACLPLQPGASSSLTLHLFGATSFLAISNQGKQSLVLNQ